MSTKIPDSPAPFCTPPAKSGQHETRWKERSRERPFSSLWDSGISFLGSGYTHFLTQDISQWSTSCGGCSRSVATTNYLWQSHGGYLSHVLSCSWVAAEHALWLHRVRRHGLWDWLDAITENTIMIGLASCKLNNLRRDSKPSGSRDTEYPGVLLTSPIVKYKTPQTHLN